MGARLVWRRIDHVFVCVAEGQGAVEAETFERFFVDLRPMAFTHFLTIARESPILIAQQRQRILALPGTSDVTLAVAFDGSPVVRGLTIAFSWFMPKVKLFAIDRIPDALDFLQLQGSIRDRVGDAVAELRASIASDPPAASVGRR
jgi:hypothetical protein